MTVDIATTDDIPALAALLEILFTQEAEFIPQPDRQIRGLHAIISNNAVGTILVLRDGEQVCGMVSLLFTISTALGGRVAILEDMIVHPERRGGGAGAKLLSAAIHHAQSSGCLRITLLTDASNTPAQRFYARAGFIPSTMLPMRLTLNDPPTG